MVTRNVFSLNGEHLSSGISNTTADITGHFILRATNRRLALPSVNDEQLNVRGSPVVPTQVFKFGRRLLYQPCHRTPTLYVLTSIFREIQIAFKKKTFYFLVKTTECLTYILFAL